MKYCIYSIVKSCSEKCYKLNNFINFQILSVLPTAKLLSFNQTYM